MVERRLHSGSDDSLTISATEDVGGVIETCKSLHNAGFTGSNEMKHAASFPLVIVEDWCKKRGITYQQWAADNKFVREMLNDPNLSAFRIWKGRA